MREASDTSDYTPQLHDCEECKRLNDAIAAARRAGLGLYGRAAKQASKNWRTAQNAYHEHTKKHH